MCGGRCVGTDVCMCVGVDVCVGVGGCVYMCVGTDICVHVCVWHRKWSLPSV